MSGVFETDPVGGPQQPDYLNAVVVVLTTLSARDLLDRAHEIEQQFGRVRTQRWGPRTLDVDIVAVGDELVDEPDLVVPHPRAAERAFVLLPWLDADPDAALPGHGPIADLLTGLDMQGSPTPRGPVPAPGAGPVRPTRLSTLIALLLGTGAVSWGALRVAESRGTVLPPLPWAAPLGIALLATAVALSTVALRRRLNGAPGTRPPQPIGVARMAVLGKAASHVGASSGVPTAATSCSSCPAWTSVAVVTGRWSPARRWSRRSC